MAPKRTADATAEGAQMPVSPRSNSSFHADDATAKFDSPSNKQIADLIAAEENAIVDDESADLDMDDEEAVDDEDSGRPYKRICRGRESALSLAMSDLTKKR